MLKNKNLIFMQTSLSWAYFGNLGHNFKFGLYIGFGFSLMLKVSVEKTN